MVSTCFNEKYWKRLESLARGKHFNLIGLFVSDEENCFGMVAVGTLLLGS